MMALSVPSNCRHTSVIVLLTEILIGPFGAHAHKMLWLKSSVDSAGKIVEFLPTKNDRKLF